MGKRDLPSFHPVDSFETHLGQAWVGPSFFRGPPSSVRWAPVKVNGRVRRIMAVETFGRERVERGDRIAVVFKPTKNPTR